MSMVEYDLGTMSSTYQQQAIIPTIRRVMPSVIAADILGVSAGGQGFWWRTWEQLERAPHRVPAEIYNRFLRLNNRRSTQSDQDFRAAGYWHASGTLLETVRWCVQTFGETGFWLNPRTNSIWFCGEDDYRLYQLTWE